MFTISILGSKETVAELENKIDRFLTAAAVELRSQLVPRTPIDKGRARAGWKERNSLKGYDIENRVPYIGALEKGRSKQAPNGFVDQSVSATVAEMKRKRL